RDRPGPYPRPVLGRPCRFLARAWHRVRQRGHDQLRAGPMAARAHRSGRAARAPGPWRPGLERRGPAHPGCRRPPTGAFRLQPRGAARPAGGARLRRPDIARRDPRLLPGRAVQPAQAASASALPSHRRVLGQWPPAAQRLRDRRLVLAGRRYRRVADRGRSAIHWRGRSRSRNMMSTRMTPARLRNIDRWGPVSQARHWTIALLVVVMAAIGLTLDELPRSPKWFWVYDLHKSVGLLVLALMLFRLGWRAYAGAPAPVPGTSRPQRIAAGVTHWLLYALVLAMPLSGWLMDSASGLRPLRWFGQVVVPKLVAPDEGLASRMQDLHENLFWVLAILVLAHVAAATWHHLFRGDATLARMLPRGWLDEGPPP